MTGVVGEGVPGGGNRGSGWAVTVSIIVVIAAVGGTHFGDGRGKHSRTVGAETCLDFFSWLAGKKRGIGGRRRRGCLKVAASKVVPFLFFSSVCWVVWVC